MNAFELALLAEAFPDQSYRPTTARREAYFSRLMDRCGGGQVTSRWRSFERQNQFVQEGRTREWLSQHSVGYAFDYVPRACSIGWIRWNARQAHLHLLEERDHLHLYVIDEVRWARFKRLVREWLNDPYQIGRQGMPKAARSSTTP